MNSNKIEFTVLNDLIHYLDNLKSVENTPLRLLDHIDCLKKYQGQDWRKFIQFNDDHYTRNLVHQGLNYDLVIISWKQGQKSPIHDHPGQGCLMKVLQGKLKEILFSNVDKIESLDLETKDPVSKTAQLCPRHSLNCQRSLQDNVRNSSIINVLKVESITYKEKDLILHQIEAIEDSVSLHIYTPGNYIPKIYHML